MAPPPDLIEQALNLRKGKNARKKKRELAVWRIQQASRIQMVRATDLSIAGMHSLYRELIVAHKQSPHVAAQHIMAWMERSTMTTTLILTSLIMTILVTRAGRASP